MSNAFFCFSILLISTEFSEQRRFVGGTAFDIIYATIKHTETRMRLVTIIYIDTLKYTESSKVHTYPVVRKMGKLSSDKQTSAALILRDIGKKMLN